MATQEDLKFAAQLVLHELVSREEMEGCLRLLDQFAGEGKAVTLPQIVLKKGLATRPEVDSILGVPLNDRQPLPDYRLIRKIAVGGMAEVYLATYLPIGEDVALKIMKPELARYENYLLRFRREAKLLMNLEHENIVKGYELRRSEGYVFCAMEHVDGTTVEEIIDETGAFYERRALWVTREIARALSYMDKRGVVHRDLKPGNVILTETGEVKLIDLGLAKLRDGMQQDSEEGVTVGTVAYLSPEQARGREDVDIRSDIYSLGVTLFHMIVGEVPFKGESNVDVIAMQVLKALESPALKSREVSALTHYLIQKMMVKERMDRFQHPDEIVAEIDEKAGDTSDAACPPPVLEPITPPVVKPVKPPVVKPVKPVKPPGDQKPSERKPAGGRRGRSRPRRSDRRGRRR